MSSRPAAAAEPDPEAPQPPAPPRCRPPRWALGTAALLAAVLAGAALGAWLAGPHLSAPGPGLPGSSASSAQPGADEESRLTATLLPQNVTLQNGTLSWYSQEGIAGVHLSSGLTYDDRRQELVVAKAGSYQVCLYLRLSQVFVLPHEDSSGVSCRVSLALHLEPLQAGTAPALALSLTPPASVQDSRCQLLQVADSQRLSVRLSLYLPAGVGKYQAWQLAQPGTKLELSRVAPQVPH